MIFDGLLTGKDFTLGAGLQPAFRFFQIPTLELQLYCAIELNWPREYHARA
jgi:hypothetical protein